jgi:hypothetical protein
VNGYLREIARLLHALSELNERIYASHPDALRRARAQIGREWARWHAIRHDVLPEDTHRLTLGIAQ